MPFLKVINIAKITTSIQSIMGILMLVSASFDEDCLARIFFYSWPAPPRDPLNRITCWGNAFSTRSLAFFVLYKNPEAIPALTSEKIEFRLKPSLEDAILPPLGHKSSRYRGYQSCYRIFLTKEGDDLMDNIEKCAHRRLCPINCEWGHNQLSIVSIRRSQYRISNKPSQNVWRLKAQVWVKWGQSRTYRKWNKKCDAIF